MSRRWKDNTPDDLLAIAGMLGLFLVAAGLIRLAIVIVFGA